MGWRSSRYDDYGYRPYVSVAQRAAKAKREVEKRKKKGAAISPVTIEGLKIAKSFWGKAWCDNLEAYSDFSNRLPRGRTYVRNGSVVDLQITPSKITALVSGSELYDVVITINALPDEHWKTVKARCGGEIGTLVELLQGKLSKSVMDVVTQKNGGLFPKPAEIKLSRSCPDGAYMCKHVAAVMYGVGARLDTQPELLFHLRKVDHLELIQGAGIPAAIGASSKGSKRKLATGDLADVFGIEMADVVLQQAVVPPQESSPAPTPAKAAKSQRVKPSVKSKTKSAASNAQSRAAEIFDALGMTPRKIKNLKKAVEPELDLEPDFEVVSSNLATNRPVVAPKAKKKSVSPATSVPSTPVKTKRKKAISGQPALNARVEAPPAEIPAGKKRVKLPAEPRRKNGRQPQTVVATPAAARKSKPPAKASGTPKKPR